MPGIFTISLDFELHWGVFDKRNREERKQCYLNTRNLIPVLLEKFAARQVEVTWATVGSLFLEDEVEWRHHRPKVIPDYQQAKYSPYTYAEKEGISKAYTWAHFAPELVKLIVQYPGQELATHTFSHYYCLEAGQGIEAFKADLEKVQELAVAKTGNKLTSLVFPRNQFNETYLKACFEAGITVIRSNPDAWYWSGINNDATTLTRKAFRTGDVFLPFGNKSYKEQTIKRLYGLPVFLPASRLLRQYDPKRKYLNKLRLNRIISELRYAAKHSECYHLWWHPENFGNNPNECLRELDIILDEFEKLREQYDMQSWAMKKFGGLVER